MPHLHLSLQSGDDLILKRMKRRHSRKDAIDFCAQVRRLRPDIALGADIIAGFPTETDEMFARSRDLIGECGLTFLHVFPFSARPGTPAARMPHSTDRMPSARPTSTLSFRWHWPTARLRHVGRPHSHLRPSVRQGSPGKERRHHRMAARSNASSRPLRS